MIDEIILKEIRKNYVVFVCGLYKSGTSLTSKILEDFFYNPAKETNPLGFGQARTGEAYKTNECNLLFEINKKIMNSNYCSNEYDELMESYILEWKQPIILKDPHFVFTIRKWLRVVNKLSLKFCVIFTNRNSNELYLSWKKAPFTSKLLIRNSIILKKMEFLNSSNVKFCQNNSIEHHIFEFDWLVNKNAILKTENHFNETNRDSR